MAIVPAGQPEVVMGVCGVGGEGKSGRQGVGGESFSECDAQCAAEESMQGRFGRK